MNYKGSFCYGTVEQFLTCNDATDNLMFVSDNGSSNYWWEANLPYPSRVAGISYLGRVRDCASNNYSGQGQYVHFYTYFESV